MSLLAFHVAGALGTALFLSPPAAEPTPSHAATTSTVTAAEALTRLQAGHARFLTQEPLAPRREFARITETSQGQHPFAIVLTCSDSRVPPEILFDQGFGDLFIVRVAGNVAGPDELGSLEYGVGHLHIPLVVVLGHSKCGAVTAAVEGGHAPGSIPALLRQIQPAVQRARAASPQATNPELVPAAITHNVWVGVETILTKSDDIAGALGLGQARVVGAVYDLSTGGIQWLGPHPRQGQLASRIRVLPSAEAPPAKVGVAGTSESHNHAHP